MARLKLILAYLGGNYAGWQTQEWKQRVQPPTVQAEVEKAVSKIAAMPVRVHGASRTDAGVHAEGQVAHCDVPDHKSDMDWRKALNACLPRDIRVKECALVSEDFHARFHVERKAYTYSLWLNRRYVPPRLYELVWDCGPLDLDKLDLARHSLVGRHDFKSFQNRGTSLKTSTRTIFAIERRFSSEESELLRLTFIADGFLKQMVRNLTGLLVACGQNKFDPAQIPALLEAADRQQAPLTAPARGLCLDWIAYA